jgi:hypothetical protein
MAPTVKYHGQSIVTVKYHSAIAHPKKARKCNTSPNDVG